MAEWGSALSPNLDSTIIDEFFLPFVNKYMDGIKNSFKI